MPHEVVDEAVRAALFVKDEPAADDISKQALFAFYHAQCTATDRLAKEAAKRGPKALNDRIKELEGHLERANQTITNLNIELELKRRAA